MTYTKTTWKDRVVATPLTYTVASAITPGTPFTLVPSEGAITESGTAITAANMNKLETQYDEIKSLAQMHKLTQDTGLNKVGGTSVNLDTITTPGRYSVNTPVNAPLGMGTTWVNLDVEVHQDGAYTKQTLTPISTTSMRQFFRTKGSTAWGAWIEVVLLKEYSPIVPALQNGWLNYAAYEGATYHKDELGFVHLTGMIKSGVMSLNCFTLPVGYRPLNERRFGAISNNGTSNLASSTNITAGGAVIPSGGANTWFSLEGITFKAEQ